MTRTVRALAGAAIGCAVLAAVSWFGARWTEHRYPPTGEFIEVDGQRLHYLRDGRGPPLLLLHGASSNLRDMQASLMPALRDDFTVVAFDRPGYGHSPRGDGPWPSPAVQAGLFLDALQAMGLQQPLVLGHSWSGSIVMAALLDHPQRVAGGVLLAGAAGHWAGSVGWSYDIARVPLLGELFAWLFVWPAGQFLLAPGVAAVLAPNPVPEAYVEAIGAPLALRPASFLHNAQDMYRLNGFLQKQSTRYRTIDAPLLAIHGEADELVPYWNHGRRLEPVVPGMQTVLLPGVGHAPHHAATARVAAAIRGFAAALD